MTDFDFTAHDEIVMIRLVPNTPRAEKWLTDHIPLAARNRLAPGYFTRLVLPAIEDAGMNVLAFGPEGGPHE